MRLCHGDYSSASASATKCSVIDVIWRQKSQHEEFGSEKSPRPRSGTAGTWLVVELTGGSNERRAWRDELKIALPHDDFWTTEAYLPYLTSLFDSQQKTLHDNHDDSETRLQISHHEEGV